MAKPQPLHTITRSLKLLTHDYLALLIGSMIISVLISHNIRKRYLKCSRVDIDIDMN